MKFFILASTVAALKPTFQLGEKIGEQMAPMISDGSATADFLPTKITNQKIADVVNAEDKKYSSYLQRPVLNLHVAETKSDNLSQEHEAINAALTAVENDEVARLEKLARSSFLQGDVQREAVEIAAAKQASDYYTALVDAGGMTGRRGVIGLLKMASLPNAKAIMNLSTVLFKVSRLAKRESTPDETRNLCGSLITYITGMPVVFQSSDPTTGSYGHSNIIVPSPARAYEADNVLAQLKAGAHAVDTSAGAYYN